MFGKYKTIYQITGNRNKAITRKYSNIKTKNCSLEKENMSLRLSHMAYREVR